MDSTLRRLLLSLISNVLFHSGNPSAVASNALRFESESSAADGTENAKDNNAAFPASRFLPNDVRTPENIPLPERTTVDSKSGGASSQVSPSNRERKIEDTLSRLTDTGRHVASHGPDHGSCLIAVIFQAVQGELGQQTSQQILTPNNETFYVFIFFFVKVYAKRLTPSTPLFSIVIDLPQRSVCLRDKSRSSCDVTGYFF